MELRELFANDVSVCQGGLHEILKAHPSLDLGIF